jgi:hypothetical protein
MVPPASITVPTVLPYRLEKTMRNRAFIGWLCGLAGYVVMAKTKKKTVSLPPRGLGQDGDL